MSTEWMEQAACRGKTDLFYPPPKTAQRDTSVARSVCDGCQVRDECLKVAVTAGETLGVWGGLSAIQRKTLRREVGAIRLAPQQPGTCVECSSPFIAAPNRLLCDGCRHRRKLDRQAALKRRRRAA